MPIATVTQGDPFRRDVPPARPDPVAPPATPTVLPVLGDVARMNDGLGTREQIEAELDSIALSVRTFYTLPADLVMRLCSAYTARLSELATRLHRVEPYDRQYRQVRTLQVNVYLDELDRQWRTASRLIEVDRQNLALIGGQP